MRARQVELTAAAERKRSHKVRLEKIISRISLGRSLKLRLEHEAIIDDID